MSPAVPTIVARCRCRLPILFALTAITGGCATLTTPLVRVVQLIPVELAAENLPNPEPSIAVNPSNPLEIVASALLLGKYDPCLPVGDAVYNDSTSYGLLRSVDGGVLWSHQCVLKVDRSELGFANDISIDFGACNRLFGAYLSLSHTSQPWRGRLFRATTAAIPPWTIDEVLPFDQKGVDQPWAAATGGGPWFAFGVLNDEVVDAGCNGGFVYWGNNPGATRRSCISSRITGLGFTSAVRTAVNSNGTMYALHYRPVNYLSSGVSADVELRRHDLGSGSAVAFGDLKDVGSAPPAGCAPRDGNPGIRLAPCVIVPIVDDWDPQFGYERRLGSQLAVAVAPANSQRVAIAYGDSASGSTSHMTLHLRISNDGGVSGLSGANDDIFSIDNATNPALAITNSGRVGFSFQRLSKEGGVDQWQTVFTSFTVANTPEQLVVLAQVPTTDPYATATDIIRPYIGDYMDLAAVEEDFYGVFSAGGTNAPSRFPQGVVPRATVTSVPSSIDPFFFRISPPCASIAISPSATITIGATAQSTVVVRDSYGKVVPYEMVVWSSSNPAVVSVSAGGVMTGIAPGAANIVATCGHSPSVQAVVAVTVTPP